MTRNKWGVRSEQAALLEQLEQLSRNEIGIVTSIENETVGVMVDGDDVVGLRLSGCYLTELPGSIDNLRSLRELNLIYNELTALPDSMGALHSLVELDLEGNGFSNIFNYYLFKK